MERMILIGNPGNRRTEGLQQARAALGLPPAVVVPYLDLLQGRTTLAEAARSGGMAGGCDVSPPLLRLDAPGEHFEVERELIALGAPDAEAERWGGGADCDRLLPYGYRSDPQPWSVRSALALREQPGRLYHPSQWFRGYGRLLAWLEREAQELWPQARWLNAPRDIAGMFDKRHTHQALLAAGVPVPRRLAAPEELPDYEALREAMLRQRMPRVFVKLASGSGACGVVAYQLNPRTGAELAVTTIGVETGLSRPPLYYNSMKLRQYSDPAELRRILNWLLQQGAHVEMWVAKAAFGPDAFDIRQLVVGGEACHSIARVSRTAITNLHLRSRRMTLAEVGLPDEAQAAVRDVAERALAAFPHSSVAGVDVLLSRHTLQPYVVDVNPFGDLLYRVAYQGCDPYMWQLRRLGVGFDGKEEPACRI